MNKKKKLVGLIFLVFVCVGGFSIFFKKMKSDALQKHQQQVVNHYHFYMKASKDTDILKMEGEKRKKVGTIYQDSYVELENIQGDYYQIKSTDYYVFYKDLLPAMELSERVFSSYLLWNEDVVTKSPTVLYQNNIKKYELERSLELPIIKKEKDFYSILLNHQIYQISTKEISEEKRSNRTLSETLENLSILYFPTDQNIERYIQYLNQEKYTYIQEEELCEFLNGSILLPKNTTMIVFENESEEVTRLIQKYNLTVQYRKDLKQVYESGDEQVTKGSSLVWYTVHADTTESRFLDMLKGRKEILHKAESIAVLNYHFFYDGNTESCNESICLEKSVFQKQLSFLKENDFKTLTMQEFNDWLDGKIDLPKKSVLITVDDGAMGTDSHLPDVLEQYDMKATLFLISGWWPLSKYRIGNLEIQSHSHDLHHNDFCQNGNCGVKGLLLTEEEILADLRLSKTTIGNPIAFCYPFYAFNDSFTNAVQKEFSLAFIGGNKKATRNVNKYKIPRYIIYKNTTLEQFKRMVVS